MCACVYVLTFVVAAGRTAYILMDRIRPPAQWGWVVRGGHPTLLETVSELGIYGVFLWHAVPTQREAGEGERMFLSHPTCDYNCLAHLGPFVRC
jgi:hypothetical protein